MKDTHEANLPSEENGKLEETKAPETTPENTAEEVVTNETTDDDGTTTKNIIITNTHSPATTLQKVKKVWNDDSNKDGIRPKSV